MGVEIREDWGGVDNELREDPDGSPLQLTDYYAGGTRVAMRTGLAGTLNYIFTDHLGSTSITTEITGTMTGEIRYYPWGGERYSSGSTPTNYRFTGQKWESSFNLYFYGARWYDPVTGRFIQADSIIPDAGNSQAYDRYAYVLNNPLKYIDPSGHNINCGVHGSHAAPEDCEEITETEEKTHYINTWNYTPWDRVGIEKEVWLRQHNMTMDDIFLGGLRDPLHLDNSSDAYGGFGGCNTKHTECTYGGHPAVDVGGALGKDVYSVGYGIVVEIGYIEQGFGNYVVIQHNVYGEIYYTVYAHLDKITVSKNDIVDMNSVVGAMGKSGTGINGSVHLHFESRKSEGINLGYNPEYPGHPFTGGSCPDNLRCGWFWPQSLYDLSKYWVDLTSLLWVDYAWNYSAWQN